jgi:hypothetical protein
MKSDFFQKTPHFFTLSFLSNIYDIISQLINHKVNNFYYIILYLNIFIIRTLN